jgi:hypothetical protein
MTPLSEEWISDVRARAAIRLADLKAGLEVINAMVEKHPITPEAFKEIQDLPEAPPAPKGASCVDCDPTSAYTIEEFEDGNACATCGGRDLHALGFTEEQVQEYEAKRGWERRLDADLELLRQHKA